MSEVQDVVQIIRVTVDGVEIAMKVSGATLAACKSTVSFLAALLLKEKSLGKTSVKKLLQRGGDIQVFQFPSHELAKVEKLAKKYGVLYSIMPDINQNDGMTEILFHSETVPRVNMMIQKLKAGKITSFDEYLQNGDECEIEKVTKPLQEQVEMSPRISESSKNETLVSRIEEAYQAKDKDLMEVCILKHQVREETAHKLKVKIPLEDKYIWIDKNKAFQSGDRRSFTIYLDKNVVYSIYNSKDERIDGLLGKQINDLYFGKKNEKMKSKLMQIESKLPVGKEKAR